MLHHVGHNEKKRLRYVSPKCYPSSAVTAAHSSVITFQIGNLPKTEITLIICCKVSPKIRQLLEREFGMKHRPLPPASQTTSQSKHLDPVLFSWI